ncbi:MAG: hypothetical protein H7222_00830 [Methylotenera sp.]|nr:hypothetical protein [Oligoflexia bacterium]
METNKDASVTMPAPFKQPNALQRISAARYPVILAAASAVAFFVLHLVILKWLAVIGLILQVAVGVWRARPRTLLSSSSGSSSAPGDDPQRRTRIQQLKRGLSKAQFEPLTEKPAAQALEQLQQNQERMTSFERTLSLKLDPGELTYGRYHEAANQVYLSIQDQINDIATRLANVISIRSALTETKEVEEAEERTRTDLRERELQKVSELLRLNESALTRMDQLTHAISEMKTQAHSASSELGPLLIELEELAQRAKKY